MNIPVDSGLERENNKVYFEVICQNRNIGCKLDDGIEMP